MTVAGAGGFTAALAAGLASAGGLAFAGFGLADAAATAVLAGGYLAAGAAAFVVDIFVAIATASSRFGKASRNHASAWSTRGMPGRCSLAHLGIASRSRRRVGRWRRMRMGELRWTYRHRKRRRKGMSR